MAIEARYFPGGADERNAYLDRPKKAKQIIPGEEQVWIGAAAKWLVEQQGAGFKPKERTFHPVWRYPATKAIADRVKAVADSMPFDIEEYLEFELPGSDNVGDWGT